MIQSMNPLKGKWKEESISVRNLYKINNNVIGASTKQVSKSVPVQLMSQEPMTGDSAYIPLHNVEFHEHHPEPHEYDKPSKCK